VPVYALGDLVPRIDPTAFVHPDAVVIGSVVIGPLSSIWPSAVLRGDGGAIVVGARTSVQDGSVVHTTARHPTFIGDGCVIGHLVHLEGCRLEDDVLVGSGAVVLHRAVVGPGSIVAANAVVRNDVVVPPGAMAAGVPATVRPGAADLEYIRESASHYVDRVARYRGELRRLDPT
jgi:carbonic anhydrase/acetyltransferase-like protein (isoleucine patch superfamily)